MDTITPDENMYLTNITTAKLLHDVIKYLGSIPITPITINISNLDNALNIDVLFHLLSFTIIIDSRCDKESSKLLLSFELSKLYPTNFI